MANLCGEFNKNNTLRSNKLNKSKDGHDGQFTSSCSMYLMVHLTILTAQTVTMIATEKSIFIIT